MNGRISDEGAKDGDDERVKRAARERAAADLSRRDAPVQPEPAERTTDVR